MIILFASGEWIVFDQDGAEIPAVESDGEIDVGLVFSQSHGILPLISSAGEVSVNLVFIGSTGFPGITSSGTVAVVNPIESMTAINVADMPLIDSSGEVTVKNPVSFTGSVNLPMITSQGSLQVDTLIQGDAQLPRIVSSSSMVHGALFTGSANAPLVSSSGQMAIESLAECDVDLFYLESAGMLSPDWISEDYELRFRQRYPLPEMMPIIVGSSFMFVENIVSATWQPVAVVESAGEMSVAA